MRTYRNPDDVQAARALAALLALVLGIGIATTLVPSAQTTILTTTAVLLGLHLGARAITWRVREHRRVRADARAAAAARATYLARPSARPDRGAA